MFSPGGVCRSFYWHGNAGLAPGSIWRVTCLVGVNVRGLALALFDASSPEEQQEILRGSGGCAGEDGRHPRRLGSH